MITKEYGFFNLYCDSCEGMYYENFERFYDAVEFAEKNGWQRKRENEEWMNICPECAKGERS